MLPMIQKPPLTARQKKAALAVAGTIDLLQLVFFPALLPGYMLDDALDVVAAVLLTAICGFKWQFALAFGLELLPIADLLPTWTAVVLLMGVTTPQVEVSPSARANAVPPLPPTAAPLRRSSADVVDVEAVVVPPVQRPPMPNG